MTFATDTSAFGRRQNGHSTSMSHPVTQSKPDSSTFGEKFGTVGVSGVVRSLTDTLIAAVPRVLSVASLRADVMAGKAKPVEHVMKLMIASVDAGKSADEALSVDGRRQSLRRSVRGRGSTRGNRRASCPSPEVHVRLVTRSIREDCEADVATAGVDQDCIASLEKARAERLDAIEQDEKLVFAYTTRIAALRAQGA